MRGAPTAPIGLLEAALEIGRGCSLQQLLSAHVHAAAQINVRTCMWPSAQKDAVGWETAHEGALSGLVVP